MPCPQPFMITLPDNFLQTHQALGKQADELADIYEGRVQAVEDSHLQAVGTALWQALELSLRPNQFPTSTAMPAPSSLGAELEQAKAASGQYPLPIIIAASNAAPPTALALPWETLYHPSLGFLGREPGFTLTRQSGIPISALPELCAEPLRVLLFTSLPDNLSERERLDVEAEQAAVQIALAAAEQKGEVILEMPDDGRFDTFKHKLHKTKPHIVYLSGHGSFEHEALNSEAWGSFLFEDEHGRQQLVKEDQLAACFSNTSVQLLVISACLSAKQHRDYPANGLSHALYRKGIPHVIGMRESVFDRAGIRFAHTLLQTISQRQPVDVAVQAARAQIVQPLGGVSGDVQGDEQGDAEAGVYKDHNNPELAKISYGQWCLPQLLSHAPGRELVDWRFTPQPLAERDIKKMLGQVSVPERLLGRRRELRFWQNSFVNGSTNRLLITGAGGMGKTALAGKLVSALKGYQVFSFSVRPGHAWKDVLLEMELALAEDPMRYKKYELIQKKELPPAQQAQWLIQFLSERYHGKLALFFDNLESVQDPHSPHSVNDAELQRWLNAARSVNTLKLIVTSRWRLPDWQDSEYCPLGRPVYGDYVAFARQLVAQKKLPGNFLRHLRRLRGAYDALGGNFRALEFFATAVQGTSVQAEVDFLNVLAQAEAEAQTDMALARVISQRSNAERELLQRMLAYDIAVPEDGVKVLVLHSPAIVPGAESTALLERLVAVSLVEQHRNSESGRNEYVLVSQVRNWLGAQTTPALALLEAAARFVLWQWDCDLNTAWEYCLATHAALKAAQLVPEQQRFVLNWIVVPLNNAGMYRVLLDEWLLPIATAADPAIRGAALGQIGKQYHHLGDYGLALTYLRQSLAIRQEIGDKSGEGTTLNDISQIYHPRGDDETALTYLRQSLAIQQEIGDKSGEGTTLNNIAMIYDARGDYETALTYLRQSLAIQQKIGDKSGEGATLNNIATNCHARGDYERALDYLHQSLVIRQEIGDKSGVGNTLNNIATNCHARGDYESALGYLRQSLAIQQEIGHKSGEGTTLNNISQICKARGDYESALVYLRQSLAIQQEIGDKFSEGATLNNIATNYLARGDNESALGYLHQSLAIQQEIGHKSGEGTTLNNISGIYRARGDYESALGYLRRSLAIRQEIGDKSGVGTTLNNIGEIYRARGDSESALGYLHQSLTIHQEIGNKSGVGTTLNNISQIYKARGDYGSALDYLRQSRAIQREIGDMAGLCVTLFNIGHIHSQKDEAGEAVQAWLTVYGIARKINRANVLTALEKLAGQIGLEGGLAGWEALARERGFDLDHPLFNFGESS